ncbi:MAG: sigma-54-dependent Fis family transcriptional regulator [Rhodospirillales bacterium]|nr:sigma-54-dependent Fis family transcriptional regulator [Alphaproteobacteria bacterium]MCB1839786.1 sigma-54-dependent Fis family transcriptional regulator [Alphaproteobacteria bacterium]MCB9977802.1 sigma-54-dependent Fis family transcriptional regulator [Rhodospirillales bacterium]
MKADILIVDDEEDIRNLIKGILEDEGYKPRLASSSKTAYEAIDAKVPDVIIQDIWLQGSSEDGLNILDKVKSRYPNTAVIMISGHGTIETAVSAIKKGAYDFIEKPFKADRLLVMIRRAYEHVSLKKENESLKRRAESIEDEIAGDSQIIKNLQSMLDRVAPTNSRVLLSGEPGTGKNLAARYIHSHSKRSENPFMILNCSTFHPERLEKELFGNVNGYLNEPEKLGILDFVNGGTLLLDEVADLPIEMQGKLVRVLQEDSFQRLGSSERIPVDIRFIASTNQDLEQMMALSRFRQDLYYRLNVVPIVMPPLRKRRHDIPVLIDNLMKTLARQNETTIPKFNLQALSALQAYDWPGNIRQLRNTLEWVLIMTGSAQKAEYGVDDLPPEIKGHSPITATGNNPQEFIHLTLREAREGFEKEYLQAQIQRFGGNISKTAQFVGMERSALHRKMKSLGIFSDDKPETDADNIKKLKRA